MSTIPKSRRLSLVTALAAGAAVLVTAVPAQAHVPPRPGAHHHHSRCAVTATDGFAQPIPTLGCRSLAQYLADHMDGRLPDILV
jgi:hypothetical protein